MTDWIKEYYSLIEIALFVNFLSLFGELNAIENMTTWCVLKALVLSG